MAINLYWMVIVLKRKGHKKNQILSRSILYYIILYYIIYYQRLFIKLIDFIYISKSCYTHGMENQKVIVTEKKRTHIILSHSISITINIQSKPWI